MPYLIDGHNLIGKTPGLSLSDPDDEDQLVALLSHYGRRLRRQMLVVFDGTAVGSQAGQATSWIRSYYARGKADDAIIARLRELKDRANYTVVTSDRDLAQRAGKLGARTQTSEAFAREMRSVAPDPEKAADQRVPPAELQSWLEEFEKRKAR